MRNVMLQYVYLILISSASTTNLRLRECADAKADRSLIATGLIATASFAHDVCVIDVIDNRKKVIDMAILLLAMLLGVEGMMLGQLIYGDSLVPPFFASGTIASAMSSVGQWVFAIALAIFGMSHAFWAIAIFTGVIVFEWHFAGWLRDLQ